MSTFAVILFCYPIVGLLLAFHAYYNEWRQGNDIMMSDLRIIPALMLMWPLMLMMEVWDHLGKLVARRDGVLIRGSLSVKVEKELSK